ncbi:hypothetical protein COY05_03540 [Candidatus Peregrinibacteria bacterium CG_4_10_14_0_2_um_filter_38_24]|nr:MAG: hypothetical protein COY05_03540 [Candidatus Peregrinibacteria bacterium CG_4_10_14_0_2_um_filter_38_24]PJC38666.1 MAG: hypothetical protein CO044_03850 [Candidatus Peregrinibacteria bacterium CG_4_9_14_0_2_um_filter_38_9]
MSTVLSARIEEKLAKRLEAASKKSNLDKTSLIRIVLLKGLAEFEQTEAVESYKKGEISLGKLGDLLNLNKWDSLSLLTEEKIILNYGKEDFEDDTKIL